MNRENPLKRLGMPGQSIWMEYIRRDLIASGEFRRLSTLKELKEYDYVDQNIH